MIDLTPQDLRLLQRNDLPSFIHGAFAQLHPQTPYLHNWHIDLIGDRLEGVRSGRIKRLIITVPPRSLKSIAVSVGFVAYVLGHDPSKRIICASYGQELANKLARDTLTVMQSPWYMGLFGSQIAKRSAVADFETHKRGGRMATSVGGILTGRGGDILIVDDAMKPDEAMSDVLRNRANTWYDETLYSRLNNKKTGAIILIMQRLHLDDMVGHVLEKEDWEVVHLPAIAETTETWHYTALGQPRVYIRKEGEALHPAREPLEALEGIKNTLGSYAFSSQYQQAPVPFGGAFVKADWFQFYQPGELPETFDSVLQSWDTANKAVETADYSVCTTWGIKRNKIYLIDVFRARMDFPDLKRKVRELAILQKATVVLIEDKASGTQLCQELRQENLSAIKAYTPEKDKFARLMAQTAQIENGKVRFPKEAKWLEAYLGELLVFPQGKNDDQVDSTSQALEYLATQGAEPGILAYYRMLSEAKTLGIDPDVYFAQHG